MKKLLSLFLAMAMMFSLAACTPSGDDASGDAPLVRIVYTSSSQAAVDVLADQLKKAGFGVETNPQPDYASTLTAVATGEWEIYVSGWTTVTGNPDYAVRDVFASYGAYNRQYLNDANIDALIDEAATQTAAEYGETYTELENILVTEQAYILPLYSSLRIMGINEAVVDESTIIYPKSASMPWGEISYVDETLNATRPLVLTQTAATLTSLDPVQANDGSVNSLSNNMSVRLVNLSTEDVITSEGSLSLNHAIAEGNQEYYFLLRDDVNFAKVEDGVAMDTGVRVGAEDVVFTLNRAKDIESAPVHVTSNLHRHMDTIEIVTDLDELNTTLDSTTGASIFETLTAGVETEVTSLVDDKTQADNANGVYQVVKVTTANPFPQVLNFIAHQSAGILSEEQVSLINADFDFATYDATTDITYGLFSEIKEGNIHLWTSGAYALTSVDDLQVTFQKNPGYMSGTEFEPNIEYVTYRFIKDTSSAASSFRAYEIDILPFVNPTDVEQVSSTEDLKVIQRSSNGVSYALVNLGEGNIMQNQDLRLAALYAIDQNAFIAVNNNLVNPAYSTVSTLIDTGNVLVQDLEKSKAHLDAYLATME